MINSVSYALSILSSVLLTLSFLTLTEGSINLIEMDYKFGLSMIISVLYGTLTYYKLSIIV